MKLNANHGSSIIYNVSSNLSVVVNTNVICEKKVNAKIILLNFKITLSKLLINRYSSRKRKSNAEEPHFIVELPQPLTERDHIVQFTEKGQRCHYCFNNEKKDVKRFIYCKSCNACLCM